MSLIQHLFSFFDFKDENIPQIPQPIYPYTPSIYPKKRYSYLLTKPTTQSISTQTEQTISNLTTVESETDIKIPASFVPKEISYTFLSSRFKSINDGKIEKLKEFKEITGNSINVSQHSEPEDNQKENISGQEFSVGSSQASNNASGDELLSNSQPNLTQKSNAQVNGDGVNNFSSINYKPKEKTKSVDTFYFPSQKQVKKEEENADTFYIPNKKQEKKEGEKSADTFYFPSQKQVKKEEENTDTFYIPNKKQETKEDEEEKSADTFYFPSKNQTKKEEEENAGTFYIPNKKQEAKEQEEKSADTFYFPSKNKTQAQKETETSGTSFTNSKSKQNTTDSEKNAVSDSDKKKELDIDAIKALIRQKLSHKTFSINFETNFNNRDAIIKKERGGFNYTTGEGQPYHNRSGFNKSSRGGGKSRFKRNFNE